MREHNGMTKDKVTTYHSALHNMKYGERS